MLLHTVHSQPNKTDNIHDIGPVIGTDSHDYQLHSPIPNKHISHINRHRNQTQSDDVVRHAHTSPDSNMLPPIYNHRNYYNDTDHTVIHHKQSHTDEHSKLNKYDRMIADADTNTKPIDKKHIRSDTTTKSSIFKQPSDISSDQPTGDLAKTASDQHNESKQQLPPSTDSHLGKTESSFPSSPDNTVPDKHDNPVIPDTPITPPPPAPTPTQPYAMSLSVNGYTIYLDNEPLYIKGIHYSPSPIGVSTAMYPYGDWLLPGYHSLWARDFDIISSMGANVIFIDDWRNDVDHGYFLDTLKQYNLKCIITYTVNGPIQQEWQRQNILGSFNYQVQKYMNHPSILGWSFGSNMNAPWNNNMLQQVSDAFGCGYYAADYNSNNNGCFNNPTGCDYPISCVYQHLFEFINTAALYTKNTMGGLNKQSYPHLIFSSMSDVDLFNSRVGKYERYAPLIDVWGLQSYPGKSWGQHNDSKLYQYSLQSNKPLLVTEYGIDAYNDECGHGYNTPCYNQVGDESTGFGENEDLQAEWIYSLTDELWQHRSIILHNNNKHYKQHDKKSDQYSIEHSGVVCGGIIQTYVDEYWRGMTSSVRGCYGPIGYGHPGFDASMCEYKAHVTCPSNNAGEHSLCGYIVGDSTYDGYANLAWFGITKPISTSAGQLDIIQPRLAYRRIQDIWYTNTYGYLWLYISITLLVIGSIITSYVYKKYQSHMSELNKLEQQVTDSVRMSHRQLNTNENTPLTHST